MANNPNIKFRSFVWCGLNHRSLHQWIQVPHHGALAGIVAAQLPGLAWRRLASPVDPRPPCPIAYPDVASPGSSQVLVVDKETMSKFYETWAFVNASADALPQLMATVEPLGNHQYTLSLDYELNRWDLH